MKKVFLLLIICLSWLIPYKASSNTTISPYYKAFYYKWNYLYYDYNRIIYATDPSTPGRIYMLQGKGLYVSNNNGDSWIPINITPKNYSVKRLLIDSNGNIYELLLYHTGTAISLYCSTDHGVTFTKIFPKNAAYIASTAKSDFCIGYNNSLYIMVTSFGSRYDSAIYKSTDDGNSWIKITDLSNISDYTKIQHIIASTTSNGKLLLVQNNNLLYSKDDGKNWKTITFHYNINDVQFDPNNDNTWFVVTNGLFDRWVDWLGSKPPKIIYDYPEIFITHDNGNSWTAHYSINNIKSTKGKYEFFPKKILKFGSNLYLIDQSLHYSNYDPGTLTYSESGIYISKDNGNTWEKYLVCHDSSSIFYSLYPRTMSFSKSNDGNASMYVMYCQPFDVLYRININNKKYNSIAFALANYTSHPNLLTSANELLITTGTGIINSNNAFLSFSSQHLEYPLYPINHGMNFITIDPQDKNILYIGMNYVSVSGYDTNGTFIYKFNKRTGNFTCIGIPGISYPLTSCIAVHPKNSKIIYVNVNNKLYQTVDGGVNWTLFNGNETQKYNYTVIKPDNPNVIFEIRNIYQSTKLKKSQILISKDGGKTWESVLEDNYTEGNPGFKDIKFSPQDTNTIYALAWDALYKSTNCGKTWQKLNKPPIGCLTMDIDQLNPKIIAVAGHKVGPYLHVYITEDGGKTWQPLTTQSQLLYSPYDFMPQGITILSYTPSDRIVYILPFNQICFYVMAEVNNINAISTNNITKLSWLNPKDPFFAGTKIYGSYDGEHFTLIDTLTNKVNNYSTNATYTYYKITCYDKRNNESKGVIVPVSYNQPPVINSFNASTSSGDVPLTVTFTCNATDPDGMIVCYKWDFDGDGHIDANTTVNTINYTYNNPGTYNATVTVVDDLGKEVTSNKIKITVNAPYYMWYNITPYLTITKSRPLYDRHNRCLFVYINIKNTSGYDLNGPIRLVIENPTIPIDTTCPIGLKIDGTTSDGNSYFIIIPKDKTLKAGASTGNLRVNFKRERKRLQFNIRIDQYGIVE